MIERRCIKCKKERPAGCFYCVPCWNEVKKSTGTLEQPKEISVDQQKDRYAELLKQMGLGVANPKDRHWFCEPFIRFSHATGRRPKNPIEWIRCLWNIDVFLGSIPLIKVLLFIIFLIVRYGGR